ncbi:MAG: flagellin, partial [Paracoccaceae bacterium]
MSSILTNNGAMVALQTMKAINKNMGQVQAEISTGKAVGSAKDNAAVWAISKVMESDVKGFKGISDSLSLGSSTVAVAQNAAETVTDLLTSIKGKIVAAQESNVDRGKIQTDISALRDQITSVVNAAQFNGLNLLSNTSKTAGTGSVNILSSLDRSATGVTASSIDVGKKDLGTGASSISLTATATATGTNNISGAYDAAAAALAGAATPATTTTTLYASATSAVAAGTGFSLEISASGGNVAGSNTTNRNDIKYVARDGDTAADVAKGLADAFNQHLKNTLGEGNVGTVGAVANGNVITFTGATGVAGDVMSIAANSWAAADTTIGGGLEALSTVDVTTGAGAASALNEVEGLIQTAIDAAASFGSARGRIDTQKDFVSNLVDSLK